ncbi:MAG: hypothetical protein U1F76_28515 [Candidatus Competibacteraceae bacterium]
MKVGAAQDNSQYSLDGAELAERNPGSSGQNDDHGRRNGHTGGINFRYQENFSHAKALRIFRNHYLFLLE